MLKLCLICLCKTTTYGILKSMCIKLTVSVIIWTQRKRVIAFRLKSGVSNEYKPRPFKNFCMSVNNLVLTRLNSYWMYWNIELETCNTVNSSTLFLLNNNWSPPNFPLSKTLNIKKRQFKLIYFTSIAKQAFGSD